jgi:hypothetical protein
MAQLRYLDRNTLVEFLTRLGAALAASKLRSTYRLYLVGETTQLFETWRDWTERLEFATEGASDDRAVLASAVQRLQTEMKIDVWEESPGEVIPLPAGYRDRARPAGRFGALDVYHFDPYSVAFRMIARGDEPDYRATLAFLQHGWLKVSEMDALLADLLPHFTLATIQQDPAEFRRKYRGLLQMWRAAQPYERIDS